MLYLFDLRARLEAEGLGLFELCASPDTQLFKDTIIKLYLPNRILPNHQFSQVRLWELARTPKPICITCVPWLSCSLLCTCIVQATLWDKHL